MAINVGGIETTLDLRITPFMRAIDSAVKKMDQAGKKAESLSSRVDKIASSMAKFGAVAAGVGAAVVGTFVSMTKATANYASEIKDAAGKTKVGVEALQGLKFATEQVGGSLPAVVAGLKAITLSSAAAERGALAQGDAYDRLRVNIRNANGELKSADEIFLALADAVRNAKDETLAMDDAAVIAGRSVFELRETFLLGRDGIEQYSKQARDLGLIMSTDDVEAADAYGDSLQTLKASFSSLTKTLSIELIPALDKYINKTIIPGIQEVTKFAKAHGELVKILAGAGGGAILTGGIAIAVANIISLFTKLSPTGLLITGAVAGLALLGLEMKKFADDAEKNLTRAFDKAQTAGQIGAAPATTPGGAPALGGKTFAGSIGDLGAAARGGDAGLADLTKAIKEFVPVVQSAQAAIARGEGSSLPAGPIFGELMERDLKKVEEVSDRQREVLQTPFEEATSSAIRFGEVAFETVSAVTTLAGGLADTISQTLVGGIQNAGKAFGQFFKQFMIQIATMIARAVILSALLSLTGGGSFGLHLGKFFGKGGDFDEPTNDQLLKGEGGRMADLLLQGMSSRMDRTSGSAETRVASSEVERSSFAPVIEVNQATEMTWVRVWDRHLEKRSRERLDRQTVRS